MQKTMLTLGLAALVTAPALADYDEAIDGDLSDSRFTPNQFDLGPGSFTISLSVVNSNDPSGDLDYFTISIADGFQLDSIVLTDLFATGFDEVAFLAIAEGPIVDTDPLNPDSSALFGFTLTEPSLVGTDLLETLNPMPVEGALPAGEWAFWVQQTGLDETFLSLEFNVSAIPGPGALAFLGLGALTRRRRG